MPGVIASQAAITSMSMWTPNEGTLWVYYLMIAIQVWTIIYWIRGIRHISKK